MAERRMFAKTIIDSDAFLDMPLSTQALYFHLSMRADDEGFINNPKKIMRMIGANQNEMELLLAKRYLLMFDSGVVVIKHWKIHNYIQKDRFKETLYKEEKEQISVKNNNSYTDTVKELTEDVSSMYPESVQDGDTGKVSIELDKSKVSKGNRYNPADDLVFFNDPEFKEVWKDLIAVRTKKKAARSDRAIKSLIHKLLDISNNDKQTAIAIVAKSADSGWSDVFKLKTDDNKSYRKTTAEEDEQAVKEIFG